MNEIIIIAITSLAIAAVVWASNRVSNHVRSVDLELDKLQRAAKSASTLRELKNVEFDLGKLMAVTVCRRDRQRQILAYIHGRVEGVE